MKIARLLATAALLAGAVPAATQDAPTAPATVPATPPKLIVAISVDQFSADLFAQYRQNFTGGFARLMSGGVFPSGYQSHAATETCPGHSTILTGSRPSRTGIIANNWYNLKAGREDKEIYCAENESVPGSNSQKYTVSDLHLRVPTLGERMKNANPRTRVVSVAGKDRAAVMMGGHKVDELWWWGGDSFVSYAGRTTPAIVTKVNAMAREHIDQGHAAMELPAVCKARDVPIALANGRTVGTGRFERKPGDAKLFRVGPEFDEAVLALAAGMVQDMKLGQGDTTDIISVGASATDYVGHTYGTEGTESCLQVMTLDQHLGKFLAVLDRTGVDYAVVLTADHGGHDIPERIRIQGGLTEAARVDPALAPEAVGKGIAARLGLSGQLLWGGVNGDIWIDPKLTKAQHDKVLAEAVTTYSAHPQVQAVFTHAQIAATPSPHGPPDTWSLLQEARASFDAERSGDLQVALKPRITPIPEQTLGGTIATHGSFWNYDRRVPILFWRKGMIPFEQPLAVETVDILPTLASLIGLKVPANEIDGRCLDLDAGPETSCK